MKKNLKVKMKVCIYVLFDDHLCLHVALKLLYSHCDNYGTYTYSKKCRGSCVTITCRTAPVSWLLMYDLTDYFL